MANYIDIEHLLQKAKFVHGRWDDLYVSKSEIISMSSANVQPVVQCKDCKHYNAGLECLIEGYGIERDPDWFCADGEKRDNG